ncbi:MAG TPA: hypothetical protein VMC85_09415 [Desulfomonilaceae bacterium]|nr:hypothetical protein [Desulfomonilaceae bacterium]
MSLKTKSNVRIFVDHLYFSVCCVLAGLLLVYGASRWTGHDFDIDENIITCIAIGAALSLILAAYLTLLSIKRGPRGLNP